MRQHIPFAVAAVVVAVASVASCGSTTTCLLKTCGGVCVDPSQDPQNCGACGTTCTGCNNAHCTALVVSASAPVGFVTGDTSNLYFSTSTGNGYQLLRVAKSGGAASSVASVASGTIEGLAVDSGRLYWTSQGSGSTGTDAVLSVAVSGGTVTTLASSTQAGAPVKQPGGIAVGGSTVYWTNGRGCAAPMCTPSISAVPAAGGTATAVVPAPDPSQSFDGRLAFSGGALYFGLGTPTGVSGIYSAPQPGNKATSIIDMGSVLKSVYSLPATAAVKMTAVAVSGTDVYWGSLGSDAWIAGSTRFTTPQDGAPTPLVGSVQGIAVDATNVYWLWAPNPAQYQLWSAPRGGGASTLVGQQFASASNIHSPTVGIVQDDVNVYWSDGQTIFRTLKASP